jgi:hypothetical protein
MNEFPVDDGSGRPVGWVKLIDDACAAIAANPDVWTMTPTTIERSDQPEQLIGFLLAVSPVAPNPSTDAALARSNVRQALRDLSVATGEVEGMSPSDVRLNAAFVTISALFPHKEKS